MYEAGNASLPLFFKGGSSAMVNSANEIKSLAVLGAGLMGHGIAQMFSLKGFKVRIYDSSQEMIRSMSGRIRQNLQIFIDLSMITEKQADNCLALIKPCRDLSECCDGSDIVIEAVNEDMAIKQELYREAEQYTAPETIICSNTSAFSITALSEVFKNKGRFLGTHFWNPPHVIPAVEVIKGEHTSDEAFDIVFDLIKKIGKEPVKVLKDVPGFLGNRLQHAMWREAVSLAEKGVASAEDIDKIVQYGFGLRLASMGPLATADFAGLDLTLSVHNYLFKYLEDAHEPSPLLQDMCENNQLGIKTGQGFHRWEQSRAKEVKKQRDYFLLQLINKMAENKPE